MNFTKNGAHNGRREQVAMALVLILGWCGCSSESQPITAQNTKYQVADDGTAERASATSGAVDSGAVNMNRGSAAAGPGTSATPSASSGQPADGPPGGLPTKPSSQGPAGGTATNAAAGQLSPLARIEQLQGQDPRGATREETVGNLLKSQREIVDLANQVLASGADETSCLRAAEAKISALSLLSQVQREAQGELRSFVDGLQQSPHASLVRLASRMEFAQRMDAFGNGQATDVPKLLADFKQLFAEEKKDEALFALSQQVIELFLQTQKSKEAGEIMRLVADTFASHANPELANAAKMVREQVVMLDVQLDEKVGAVLAGKPMANEEFLAALDKLLAGGELGAVTLQIVSQVAQMIESHSLDLADKTYEKVAAAYSKNPSEPLAKAVTEMAASFAKRKAIVGQTFAVAGNLMDGRPFEWNKLQGKVVLVDFWATWCGPCLAEIPNIKKNYEQYREQGFEVIGVNLDDNPQDVQRFFSRQQLPWPTVFSADPQKTGFDHPLAVQCGVQAIPFLVLVDRDGKALALNPRGEKLGEQLAKLFPATPGAAPVPGAAPASQEPANKPGS